MTMGDDLQKVLSKDTDGLLTYEYIANHMGHCDDEMGELADNINKGGSQGTNHSKRSALFTFDG